MTRDQQPLWNEFGKPGEPTLFDTPAAERDPMATTFHAHAHGESRTFDTWEEAGDWVAAKEAEYASEEN